MKPHKHAELIKAWADNQALEIEYFSTNGQFWRPAGGPAWDESLQYRIKPAEPEVEYPVTLMTDGEIKAFAHRCGSTTLQDCRDAANAALRHAIDAQQVVRMAEVQEIASELSKRMRAAREHAVAEAVRTACMNGRYAIQGLDDMDLAAIIAKVK